MPTTGTDYLHAYPVVPSPVATPTTTKPKPTVLDSINDLALILYTSASSSWRSFALSVDYADLRIAGQARRKDKR